MVLVPMEEIVRAFNYVIEKGWVSSNALVLSGQAVLILSTPGALLGYF